MNTYLVTFGNIFESVKFMENPKQYFTNYISVTFNIKSYNSKFFQITTARDSTFLYALLKRDFPQTKVVLKLQRSRTHYIKL